MSEIKTFMLDCSVFLHDPNCIFCFQEHRLVVPSLVITQLKEISTQAGERGANARLALRKLVSVFHTEQSLRHEMGYIENIMDYEDDLSVEAEDFDVSDAFPYTTANVNTVTAVLENAGSISILHSGEEKDIITVAEKSGAILITKDSMVRLIALSRNQPVEDYRHGRIAETERFYSGRSTIYLPGEDVATLSADGSIECPQELKIYGFDDKNRSEVEREQDYRLSENEFLIIKNSSNPQSGGILGRYANGKIHRLRHEKDNPFGVTPKNVGQKFAIEALMASSEEAPLVILKGPAGTAKTFLSLACGLQQAYEENAYCGVLVARQSSLLDDSPGYLPGTEQEKIAPLHRSTFDNVNKLLSSRKGMKKDGVNVSPADELISRGTLQLQAMTFMRGRSIQEEFVIIDEAQNTTPAQAITLVTRPSAGSKIIFAGDIDQIDAAYLDRYSNGLTFLSEKMRGSPLCWQVTFQDDECERSPLANEAIHRLIQK